MATLRLPNRTEAGRRLAAALAPYRGRSDVLVLALPRGGVPVAAEVAAALGAPLDLIIVRKLGLPGQEELAIGAIASGGAIVFNEDLLSRLPLRQQQIDAVLALEREELARRERAYRGERPPPLVAGKVVILVDDGLATGASMRAAVAALRQQRPAGVVVAVPVAPPDTAAALADEVDELVCLSTPEPFYGVGNWYDDFSQTSDEEVRAHLQRAWRSVKDRPAPRAGERP